MLKSMNFRETINHLKISPEDGWYYLQGTFRYDVYKITWLRWILRSFIREQYEWRRDVAANPCFKNGECLCCGCETPALFFADKSCSAGKLPFCVSQKMKVCYPKIMSRKNWKEFKKKFNI